MPAFDSNPTKQTSQAGEPSGHDDIWCKQTHHTRMIISRLYEVYKQGDIPSVVQLLADSLDWRTVGLEAMPFGHACYSRDEVAAWFGILGNMFDFLEHNLTAVVVDGTRAVGLGTERLRHKRTGKELTCTFADSFEVRDGKIVFYRFLTDTASFLAAFN